MENAILDDVWEVKRQVGKGTFCDLFIARNLHKDELVAIKIQSIDGPVVKYEGTYVIIITHQFKFFPTLLLSYLIAGLIPKETFCVA